MKFSHCYAALENELLQEDCRTLINGWKSIHAFDLQAIAKINLSSDAHVVREAAVRLGPLPTDLLEQALNDSEARVRAAAVDMNTLSREQLATALQDHSPRVRLAAVQHWGLNSEQMHQVIQDEDYLVRWAALEAGPVTDMQLGFLAADPAWQVRAGALILAAETHRLTPELLDHAANDTHPIVRQISNDLAPRKQPKPIVFDSRDRDIVGYYEEAGQAEQPAP